MGDPVINFRRHQTRANSDGGARDDFEAMVTDLVGTKFPGVWGVRANPGDWGMDALVGELDGKVSVWQAKYFIDGVGKTQWADIKESFASVLKHAAANDHQVTYWILCIPVDFDPPGLASWQRWKRATEKAHPEIIIEVWPANKLRRLLMAPEANDILHHYYGDGPPGRAPRKALQILELEDGHDLGEALFVRQMHAAGYVSATGAMRQFFNAEILERDVLEKGIERELDSHREAKSLAWNVWEERFNANCASSAEDTLPKLLPEVMDGIRLNASSFRRMLPASHEHFQGMAHQWVEARQAGWIRSWPDVAKGWSNETASPVAEATGSQGVTQREA